MADKIIERIGKKVEVENVRLTDHTVAKNWLRNGGDVFSLHKSLGHRT